MPWSYFLNAFLKYDTVSRLLGIMYFQTSFRSTFEAVRKRQRSDAGQSRNLCWLRARSIEAGYNEARYKGSRQRGELFSGAQVQVVLATISRIPGPT